MFTRLMQFFGEAGDGSPDRYSLFQNEEPLFAEQQKAFCSTFEHAVDTQGLKVVAIVSSIAGEGKTVSTVNLARHLASTGRKEVVLVDLDLRKSDLAKGLRFRSVPGVVELLEGSAGMETVLRRVSSRRLSIIPSGKRVSDPWELLTGSRFREFIGELRGRYDLVLLDTPPVVPVSDAISIRDLVDGYVLVFRLGFTPHALFRQSLEGIGEKQLVGVLLNGVPPRSQRYYQRYYGKYYTKPDLPRRD